MGKHAKSTVAAVLSTYTNLATWDADVDNAPDNEVLEKHGP